jgi:hypothetical protein
MLTKRLPPPSWIEATAHRAMISAVVSRFRVAEALPGSSRSAAQWLVWHYQPMRDRMGTAVSCRRGRVQSVVRMYSGRGIECINIYIYAAALCPMHLYAALNLNQRASTSQS